jgi:hypothetical protein
MTKQKGGTPLHEIAANYRAAAMAHDEIMVPAISFVMENQEWAEGVFPGDIQSRRTDYSGNQDRIEWIIAGDKTTCTIEAFNNFALLARDHCRAAGYLFGSLANLATHLYQEEHPDINVSELIQARKLVDKVFYVGGVNIDDIQRSYIALLKCLEAVEQALPSMVQELTSKKDIGALFSKSEEPYTFQEIASKMGCSPDSVHDSYETVSTYPTWPSISKNCALDAKPMKFTSRAAIEIAKHTKSKKPRGKAAKRTP